MFYKKKEKSFFENAIPKEIIEPAQDAKEGLEELEKKGAKKVLKWYDFGASSFRTELKKHPAQYFFLFTSTLLGSVITSSIALLGFSGNLLTVFAPHVATKVVAVQSTPSEKVYQAEKFDPLLLASKLRADDKDFELVDIRGLDEYKKGHILKAVNVPVYSTPLITKNGDLDKEKVKEAFKQFMGTDKLLIIYAQNSYSTLPADIAFLLNSGAKRVKILAVGWEEWLHLQAN